MLRAVQTFHAGDRTVAAGAEVHDHDEIVVGREHLFESIADESKSSRKRPASSGKAEV